MDKWRFLGFIHLDAKLFPTSVGEQQQLFFLNFYAEFISASFSFKLIIKPVYERENLN
jgi:hypothetical protein